MRKKLFFIIIFLTIMILPLKNIIIQAKVNNVNDDLIIDAKSGCLIESKTNSILYSKNENEKLAPASMTKIMTMLLVMEKIDNNIISLNDIVTTPKQAASLGGSQIYLSEGEKMTVNDLLKAMCIASANDAAMSLAIFIGGTEKNFVQMMNDKVKDLNLKNTNFVNPYGFDDPNHYSSSYDMVCIASHLINNHPTILEYTSIYEDYVREDTEKRFWLVNTNKLVKFVDGVDGLKTGWTNNSGYCLTATINKNNERFIAVTMGNSSPTIRNTEITNLLYYGVNNFETKKLISKNDVIKEIKNVNSKPNNIIFKCSKDVIIVKRKNESLKQWNIVENININNEQSYIDVYYNNQLYTRVYLITDSKIYKANIFDLIITIFKELFLTSK